MEGSIGLGTFAELGVALVGFAALIAVFRGGSIGSWHPRARLAFWYIVSHGLGALFFAIVPSIFLVFSPHSWSGALAALALFHGAAYCLFFRRHLVLLREGIPTPNNWYFWFAGSVAVANVTILGVGAFGGFSVPPRELYSFGVASCLLLAGGVFIAVLRLDDPPAV